MVDRDTLCRALIPTALQFKEIRSADPNRFSGQGGLDLFHLEWRHFTAIRLLQEAEQFQCANRVVVLFEIAETLDYKILPNDFFHRLIVLQNRLRRLGRKRPRNKQRDEEIRQNWSALRKLHYRARPRSNGVLLKKYEDAIAYFSDAYMLSEKSIEAIASNPLDQEHFEYRIEDLDDFFIKLRVYYPKKSNPTSR